MMIFDFAVQQTNNCFVTVIKMKMKSKKEIVNYFKRIIFRTSSFVRYFWKLIHVNEFQSLLLCQAK